MSDSAITTTNLGKQFRGHWAVHDLNLSVPTGAAFGLLGENGAGKTTTLQMLMGLLPPTAGDVNILGLNPATDDVAVKTRVGYVAEKHGFYEQLRVEETIAMVAAYHPTWNEKLCNELKDEFSLPDKSKISTLSKGMRAKLALLLALSFEPEVLILDEPAGGLDPAARRHVIETILGRYQETGRTIFLSSHLLNEFSGLLDHVAFLREGGVDLIAPVEELQQTIKRVRLVFEDGTPEGMQVPGSIDTRLNGREVIAVIDQFDGEATVKSLEGLNPSQVLVEDLTLEDIFVARTS